MNDHEPDPMDVASVLAQLDHALVLQQRSVLQMTRAAGSLPGLEFQAVAARL